MPEISDFSLHNPSLKHILAEFYGANTARVLSRSSIFKLFAMKVLFSLLLLCCGIPGKFSIQGDKFPQFLNTPDAQR